MQHKVKVTIGFCVKNNEATVKEAIDSVVNQDFPHKLMELVVVDGNSKDKTMSIVKKALLNTDIKTKILFENKGLGVARQMVVDNGTGDYIIWVDGDMVLQRDHVRKQVEFMELNPTVGIAVGKFEMYPEEDLIATLDSIEWMAMEIMYGQKASSVPVLHAAGGSTYRVSALREVGGFDCCIKGALEDWDTQYRIKERGWSTLVTTARFYSRRKETWLALWNQNLWYGYGGHYIFHKHKKGVAAKTPLEPIECSIIAYKLTRRKVAFLLPIQYVFKKIAWLFGFFKAHFDGYGHSVARVHPK